MVNAPKVAEPSLPYCLSPLRYDELMIDWAADTILSSAVVGLPLCTQFGPTKMKYTAGLFKASGLLAKGCDMVTPLKAKTSGPRPTGRKSSVELAGLARLIARVAPKISGRSQAWAAKSLCANVLVALSAEPSNLSLDATAVLKF